MKTKANRVRPHAACVRFTEDEFKLVEAAANANFTSIGSYIRQRLLKPAAVDPSAVGAAVTTSPRKPAVARAPRRSARAANQSSE